MQRCAAIVFGEVQASHSFVHVAALLPSFFEHRAVVDHLIASLVHHDVVSDAGLSPPPTLLNLSCSLNS